MLLLHALFACPCLVYSCASRVMQRPPRGIEHPMVKACVQHPLVVAAQGCGGNLVQISVRNTLAATIVAPGVTN